MIVRGAPHVAQMWLCNRPNVRNDEGLHVTLSAAVPKVGGFPCLHSPPSQSVKVWNEKLWEHQNVCVIGGHIRYMADNRHALLRLFLRLHNVDPLMASSYMSL